MNDAHIIALLILVGTISVVLIVVTVRQVLREMSSLRDDDGQAARREEGRGS